MELCRSFRFHSSYIVQPRSDSLSKQIGKLGSLLSNSAIGAVPFWPSMILADAQQQLLLVAAESHL